MTQEEYERIADTYADMVFRAALSYAKAKEDAEDATQNTFLRLLKCREDFQSEEHIRRWLLHVAVNECKRIWGSAWRKKVEFADRTDELPAFEKEDYTELYQAVQALPPKLRIVIHLYYYEGYPSKEIAEILKIRDATVRNRLLRARKLLKDRLTRT